jgi:hypothetical protein
MIRFHNSYARWLVTKANLNANAHLQQRTVDQIYLCGNVQSHTTLALSVVKGSTPEFMKE